MPAKKRPKPLYQRGKFALYAREGRANLEIVWYDAERKRERSTSAGTAHLEAGRVALDRLFLADDGHRVCTTCRRPWDGEESPLLLTVIADYLLKSEEKAGYRATKQRLAHVTEYLIHTDPTMTCAAATEDWANKFRAWMAQRSPKRGPATYSLSLIEGCVMQAAAAITAMTETRAPFKAEQMKTVARSPRYRAPVKQIAEMFTYCLRPQAYERSPKSGEPLSDKEIAWRIKERATLLRFLRAAVPTWARPDAVIDITSAQWISEARVLDLNPPGRRQTKKYRPMIPMAKQFAPFLDELEGNWLSVNVLNQPWTKMAKTIGLPTRGEAGPKLIRRSMAHWARKRIGEERWRQGEIMLGHVKASISDIYAIPDPANLGLALAATEEIIDEIIALEPMAYRHLTADAPKLKLVEA